MRNIYVGLSEFLASALALFARPSACFLGAVLLAMTLSSCAPPPPVSVEDRELNNALDRCDNFLAHPNGRNDLPNYGVSVCSAAQWEKIEGYAERNRQNVGLIRRIRDDRRRERQAFDRATLNVYLDVCADGNQTWHCRLGGVWGFDYLEAIAEKEGTAKQLRELRAIREALELEAPPQATATPEERETAFAASFGIQDFRKLVDEVVENMVNDRGLKEDLGATRPTLLIAPITNRSDANIDTQLANNSIRVRLSKARLFALVSRGQLETLLQEQQLEQSGLADSDTAAQVGQMLGAQYVLHGSVTGIRTRQEGELQIVYTLTLIVTEIETGLDFWVDEAEVIKTS